MAKAAPSIVTHAGAFAGRLSPGMRPALVVIDMVNAYLEPSAPLFVGDAGSIALGSAKRLCNAARRAGAPVFLTSVEYDARGVSGGLFYRKVPALSCFIKGSPLAAFPAGLAADGDAVIVKQYASAFFATSLASTLCALGVDTVLLCGFSTSGCVRASAVDAIQHGFAPFVVRDACADRAEAPHAANLHDIAAKYGEVIDEEAAKAILAPVRPAG